MQAKHTKGELTVMRGRFGSSVFVLYGQDNFPIAQTISNSSPEGMERARRGEHEANAWRLATAWNCHDDLLEAAKLALKTAEDWINDGSFGSANRATLAGLQSVRDAITKATGA